MTDGRINGNGLGVMSTVAISMLAVIFTIGGLVTSDISQRISLAERNLELSEARAVKRDDATEARLSSRIEDVNTKLLELMTIKAEFNATIRDIHERQRRNETFIEANRTRIELMETIAGTNTLAETINRRIDQIYTLYRELLTLRQQELSTKVEIQPPRH